MEYLTDFARYEIACTLLALGLLLVFVALVWVGDRLDGGKRE